LKNFYFLFFKFYDIEFKFNLYKWINLILKLYFTIWNFTSTINFKNFLYYKILFFKSIKYYSSLVFTLKNKNIVFKPNYYYYRIHNRDKLSKKMYHWKYNRNIKISSFKSTKLRHTWNSFRHYTKNFYFFKNLYRFNFTNYFYSYHNLNLSGNSFAIFYSIFFPLVSLKYTFFNFTLIWFIFYIFFILFFFFF